MHYHALNEDALKILIQGELHDTLSEKKKARCKTVRQYSFYHDAKWEKSFAHIFKKKRVNQNKPDQCG